MTATRRYFPVTRHRPSTFLVRIESADGATVGARPGETGMANTPDAATVLDVGASGQASSGASGAPQTSDAAARTSGESGA